MINLNYKELEDLFISYKKDEIELDEAINSILLFQSENLTGDEE
jgi:hypothetical protein